MSTIRYGSKVRYIGSDAPELYIKRRDKYTIRNIQGYNDRTVVELNEIRMAHRYDIKCFVLWKPSNKERMEQRRKELCQ